MHYPPALRRERRDTAHSDAAARAESHTDYYQNNVASEICLSYASVVNKYLQQSRIYPVRRTCPPGRCVPIFAVCVARARP